VGSGNNITDLYSASTLFKSQLQHQIAQLRFLWCS